ncbi:NADPH-dependent oxidoreductase [Oecophyllibacter saccharovorans]|uniref:NADPH-dependent oxidoreductase n=1 Tax=Oecophyllibacter saccharovorans TaxID=2558360 RepID=A0A506URS7_9PROT|nr:NADPH-dependent oxidoreductase [Oecophyllibacter saccharovorans]TPW36055.1 NADPH-dependent oxidoreductase [Oecophyllibacter saccharovorans]
MPSSSSPSAAALADLWYQRYRTALPAELATLLQEGALPVNDVLLTALRHHSVRHYADIPLPAGALELGIAAASSAPTSSNLQTWSVVAVEDPARRQELAELSGHQPYVAQAPLFLTWIVDLSRLERMAEREGLGSAGLDHHEAFLMASFDTALAAQNSALAFESMGLGTVFIGGLRNEPEKVAELLGLPPRCVAVCGLSVGVPAQMTAEERRPAIKPRLGQEVILHREHYSAQEEPAHIAAYDSRADAYQQEQGLPSRQWSSTAAGRMAEASGLGERAMMGAILKRLGFPLK